MFRVPNTTTPTTRSGTGKITADSQSCSYGSYECKQTSLDGYAYCAKHILKDPTAPYKQCNFVYNTNGRKCLNPALKGDRRDLAYCSEHARKAQLARIKSTSRHSPPQTPETLLLNLSHYVKPADSSAEDTDDEEGKSKVLDPFAEIDAYRINASGCDVLDYASSSDSDVEPVVVSETLRGAFLDDSEDESLQSSQEDPLKHAGIFTAEEVIYVTREKLIKLQSLYIDQFRRLQYVLREKRRKYLHNIKKEKETSCSIHDQPRETAKEKKIYEKLKALNRYHRRSGVEAILYKKSLERRAQATEGPAQKPPNLTKCIFTEGGVKCGDRTLPAAKHCRKHILKDQHQVLFKACGAIRADIECHEPVPAVFDTSCVFHMNLPPPIKLESMAFEEAKPAPHQPTPTPTTPTPTTTTTTTTTRTTLSSTPTLGKEHSSTMDNQSMEIDVVGEETQEIDPDDDMAGLMREMNDAAGKKSIFNDSVNSEASTDTAFSITATLSDKDELILLS